MEDADHEQQCCHFVTYGLLQTEFGSADDQVGGTYWLTNLARRDREWQVRACALGLLSRLASPVAPAMQCMLLQAWRDGPAIAAQVRAALMRAPGSHNKVGRTVRLSCMIQSEMCHVLYFRCHIILQCYYQFISASHSNHLHGHELLWCFQD